MEDTSHRAIAIVGAGAILPDAPNAPAFWENIKNRRYSVTEVDPQRWDPALYYDPDPTAPDKSYSKIGGWVRNYAWDPMRWHLPVPPRVVEAMDGAQKWAIACTREALEDYGYPKRPLDPNRTAVILGNAMAGEKHYLTSLRIQFPEYARELSEVAAFAALPEAMRRDITQGLHDRIARSLPEITEDSMPGELANCIAGRIANLFNFHGPNYVCDAACASAMAAISSAVEGLIEKDFDAVITGGVDRNMGAQTFVKFCKIGALSATGSRPYAAGADGFVMGEGTAIFVFKRLADAERDGDKIYAVLRGIGGSSDGKGKGITAPNPVGPKLAIERAWQSAGLSPAMATLIEGHGTSTRVGDLVELQTMVELLGEYHLPAHSIALGSVKSNFGHLKGAAGAAGLLKTALALHEKVLPPSVNCEHPNPDIDFAHSPLYVNTELKPWTVNGDGIRRAGLSAFGFGGTNFHAVLEEYIPHRLNGNRKHTVAMNVPVAKTAETTMNLNASSSLATALATQLCKAPLRGALVIGAASETALIERLRAAEQDAKAGQAPAPSAPAEADLKAQERIAIDFTDAADLAAKAGNALKAVAANQAAVWKALRAQGIFRGHGVAPKVAFLYPGQGSQYVNMLKPLRDTEPIVAETFAEADRVMTPLLGKPLTEFIFVDHGDGDAVAKSEDDLRQTAITQPAVLAADLALTRLLSAYGIAPDFAIGHSLGEYGALLAAEAIPFADALEAVSARGREMTRFSPEDKGLMAAVFAPLEEVERILQEVDGYVVIANVNSNRQAVVGGASNAVTQATEAFLRAGYEVSALAVSHAFHTSIVASASEPLRRVLERLHLAAPRLPVVANINGAFYPTGTDVVPQMIDILAQQVAAPVQFVKGLQTLYDAGARVFVEVGPKKALQGFAEDVLGGRGDVISLFTNHPKVGDLPAFNQALCCLYAAGLGRGIAEVRHEKLAPAISEKTTQSNLAKTITAPVAVHPTPLTPTDGDHYGELGRLFAEVLERGWKIYQGDDGPRERSERPTSTSPVAITGAALGLPGTEHVFDDANIGRLLRGEQFIETIPARFRRAMLDKHITRLVKSDEGGAFETITNVADVIKLAGRGGAFDLESEFGVSAERRAALDRDTQLAIAVGLDALRDAGIPLVMRYKTTSKGTKLPDRWVLPEALRDDTGVVFASAFPGLDSFAHEMSRYHAEHARREQVAMLQSLRARITETNGYSILAQEIDRRIEELCDAIEKQPYVFDRRYLFRVLPMGHSQFAEFIGARGPNTAVNAACASTTLAVSLAEDWIRAGRCRRVIVLAADDITTDSLIDWMSAGFLATGAAAIDDVVEEAAVPFDRRRHGMIIGMGAAGLVIESADAARERGMHPICEVLGAATANSAFHGTRLDVQHIGQVMEELVSRAEEQHGIRRQEIAPRTVFVSHETYTPARGGSAAAEIHALRRVFGDSAGQIVIANTKGFTGHAMGAGIEDVLAVKALETGVVPPVANFKQVDPELGALNLSKGGVYPVEYALRLGAGFGSQISMTLLRWVKTKDGLHKNLNALGYASRIADEKLWNSWLSQIAGHPQAGLEVVNRTLRVRDRSAVAPVLEFTQRAGTEQAPLPTLPDPGPVILKKSEAAAVAPVATPVVETRPVAAPSPQPPAAI
ncbi:MAG TPA: beta-ketoacyl synthase N-terminal-like domain-containing protein, partial [Terriglobales bacterium]